MGNMNMSTGGGPGFPGSPEWDAFFDNFSQQMESIGDQIENAVDNALGEAGVRRVENAQRAVAVPANGQVEEPGMMDRVITQIVEAFANAFGEQNAAGDAGRANGTKRSANEAAEDEPNGKVARSASNTTITTTTRTISNGGISISGDGISVGGPNGISMGSNGISIGNGSITLGNGGISMGSMSGTNSMTINGYQIRSSSSSPVRMSLSGRDLRFVTSEPAATELNLRRDENQLEAVVGQTTITIYKRQGMALADIRVTKTGNQLNFTFP